MTGERQRARISNYDQPFTSRTILPSTNLDACQSLAIGWMARSSTVLSKRQMSFNCWTISRMTRCLLDRTHLFNSIGFRPRYLGSVNHEIQDLSHGDVLRQRQPIGHVEG